MKVFKFGGASVKDADSVLNVIKIINLFDADLMVVISAMGKTTNAMEKVVDLYFNKLDYSEEINFVHQFHQAIIKDLGLEEDEAFASVFKSFWDKLRDKLVTEPSVNYDYEYDQIVSFGELFSTAIVSGALNAKGIENEWVDARKIIRTSNDYREGIVDWELTQALFKSKVGALYQDKSKRSICVTQGFIGHTDIGQTTTLGREGSDFTAGIAAWCLSAEDVTIWKDVPGMLNADPKLFNNTKKLSKISFKEAIELSYYGASVIHPKTIKPLQNKGISLYVKSFLNPMDEGTIIQAGSENDSLIPSFIYKDNQLLISISPRDFSFITEQNMRDIFNAFSEVKMKINLMQNSAISFSVCVDEDPFKLKDLMGLLEDEYLIKYNDELSLLTIRHYNDRTIDELTKKSEILVEQKSRQTARFVTRKAEL
ncbi:MAG: aspartate kinase [Flavobacteriales bacterium]|jgi:aspartate kinase